LASFSESGDFSIRIGRHPLCEVSNNLGGKQNNAVA